MAGAMVGLHHSDDLTDEELGEIRALMDAVFGAEFSDDDWAHALGGTHALMRDGSALVAHGSVVPRSLLLDKRPLRVGYVEALGVAPEHQGRGYGAAVMDALED